MTLYHKDVFMPEQFLKALPNKEMRIVYSQHAIGQADAKYEIDAEDLPVVVNPSKVTIVEVETDGQGKPFKFVLHLPFSHTHDICIPVIIMGTVTLFAKTVWLNKNNDKHSTLRVSQYAKSY